jgi:hypothetical protein
MRRKPGRPAQLGLGIWRHPAVLARRVRTIVGRRDAHLEETVTDVAQGLAALAGRVVGRPLSARQLARLRRLAATAKPSHITRTLLSWRFQLPDRTVRVLMRTDVNGLRWG